MNATASGLAPLELWAGIECTVNRVKDEYFEQLGRNGHAVRLDDLDRFAALGVSALRYPVLWERIAPNGLESADWRWTDERLAKLRELNVRPIAGLVHHGSGPRSTSLLDSAFPEKLAEFAFAVADRYPDLTHYTPINEPLTTARFSGLYGHWYPHGQDELTFAQALLIECRAVVLAMQAIRRVNPAALLVQTEDLGKIFSTPLLAYQAEFENIRRWLTFDLLCGRVDAEHRMWHHLRSIGIQPAELEWFLAHPCPPDILGINYYLTSDRFLDERLDRYPAHTHGGNGRHAYADVEAVRVCADGIAGHAALLQETWERYKLPIAIAEVHLGCTREEQLRWLQEAHAAAETQRTNGADVRALTVWSLLGAYDWSSLLTRSQNDYESGVFDLRPTSKNAPIVPRPTALAAITQQMAQGKTLTHPVLDAPGWWRRPDRLLYPPVHCTSSDTRPTLDTRKSRPIVITGATGTLGRAFARLCELRGLSYRLLTRQEMDITNSAAVQQAIAELQPWAVINTAGYVRVDDAEREPEQCRSINAAGAAALAAACASQAIAFVTFSSDLVFDGRQTSPYLESNLVAPLNVYGQSKAIAEQSVCTVHPQALVIRTSAFFSPWDEYNFLTLALRSLRRGEFFAAVEDAIVSPTYVPDLVHATLNLLIDGESGIWHLANSGAIAWSDWAGDVANRAGLNAAQIEARPTASFHWPARRPAYSVLGSERGILLPPLDNAIDRYLHELAVEV